MYTYITMETDQISPTPIPAGYPGTGGSMNDQRLDTIHSRVQEAFAITRELANVLHEQSWETNTAHIPLLASAAAEILDNADSLLYDLENT